MRLPRNFTNYVLLTGILGLLSIFLLYPIYLTLRGAFYQDLSARSGFTLENVARVFEDPMLVQGLLNSFAIAAGTTFLAMCIGVPLAILSVRYKFPLKTAFNALILVPLILPPFVGAIGVKMLLGREGALNSLLGTEWDILAHAKFFGVIVVQALSLYPIIYLNASAALANLDPALDEAAQNVGAGFWKRLLTITLPLIRPGLFAGGTIVFIWPSPSSARRWSLTTPSPRPCRSSRVSRRSRPPRRRTP